LQFRDTLLKDLVVMKSRRQEMKPRVKSPRRELLDAEIGVLNELLRKYSE